MKKSTIQRVSFRILVQLQLFHKPEHVSFTPSSFTQCSKNHFYLTKQKTTKKQASKNCDNFVWKKNKTTNFKGVRFCSQQKLYLDIILMSFLSSLIAGACSERYYSFGSRFFFSLLSEWFFMISVSYLVGLVLQEVCLLFIRSSAVYSMICFSNKLWESLYWMIQFEFRTYSLFWQIFLFSRIPIHSIINYNFTVTHKSYFPYRF